MAECDAVVATLRCSGRPIIKQQQFVQFVLAALPSDEDKLDMAVSQLLLAARELGLLPQSCMCIP